MIATPNELKRKPNETIKAYKLRLGNTKHLYPINWNQIADLINKETGENFSESKYRKWFFPYMEGYSDALSAGVNNVEQLKEIENQRRELEKEKIRLQDQRREYKNLLRYDARSEHLKNEVLKAAKEVSLRKPLIWTPPLPYLTHPKEAVLLISDWHYGIISDNYWNKFNPDIFYDRINSLVLKTIEYGKQQGIKTLHVMNLGDMVSGLIHVSVRVQSSEDVISQTKMVAETISEMLVKLSSEFERVKFYSVRGNHDRVVPQKNDQISKESFADIIPWYVQARVSYIKNLEIIENTYDDEMIVADVCGNYVIGVHGHKERLNEVASNLPVMLKIIPSSIVLGHYHHNFEKEFNGIDVIVNPTLSGTDEYARDIRKTSKPAQKMLIYDQTGQICTYKILL
ncbi:metallophosphoesterase [Brevibacillus laterosporus]|uniref:metallophosphoesterase n=1 Tax=Brevibacillus laterosporus TaxID=1465 RepID=UPI0035A60551